MTPQQKWRIRNPDKYKEVKRNNQKRKYADLSQENRIAFQLKKRYKLSMTEWVSLFDNQKYKCAICLTDVKTITESNDTKRGVVDHCHKTNKVRGILCHNCNRALGLVKEDTTVLKNIIEYLNVK